MPEYSKKNEISGKKEPTGKFVRPSSLQTFSASCRELSSVYVIEILAFKTSMSRRFVGKSCSVPEFFINILNFQKLAGELSKL
jgi:hypothetical protein